MSRRRSPPTLWQRLARGLRQLVVAVMHDVDTYVCVGIVLMAVGVGSLVSTSAGVLVAGAALFCYAIWLSYWQLSATRPGTGGEE